VFFRDGRIYRTPLNVKIFFIYKLLKDDNKKRKYLILLKEIKVLKIKRLITNI